MKEVQQPFQTPPSQSYCFGRFTLDLVRGTLHSAGEEIKLRPKSFELLRYLVENSGRLIGKEELIAAIWPDTAVSDDSLGQCVKDVRRALDDDSQELIKTVPRRGYLFAPEVTRNRTPSPPLADKRVEAIRLAPAQPVKGRVAFGRRSILVVGLLVVMLAGLGWFFLHAGRGLLPGAVPTIAVLPFKPLVLDLTNRVSDERLGVGMADALITQLSRIQGIVVRPTSAVLRYTGPQEDVRAAGQNLRVDSLLQGSIQTSGDRIRVTVQLVSVQDGKPLWGETFDEKFTGIFEVQDSIAQKVVEALRLKLTPRDSGQWKKRYASNPKASRLYLEGRFFWTKQQWKSAIDSFRKTLTEDPEFAPAQAGLADCYTALAMAGNLPSNEALPTAKAAALQALEKDATLAEAHASLGFIKSFYEWDWNGGERELQRAIELDPGSLSCRILYGQHLACVGRLDAALSQIKRGLDIDPFAPIVNARLGLYLYFQRHYDQAIEQAQRTLQLQPNFGPAYIQLGWSYEQKAMWPEAVAALERAHAISTEDPRTTGSLARAYAISGKRADALRLIDELLTNRKYVSPFWVAEAYVGLGDKDRAFEWLERGYRDHDLTTPIMNVCPLCDPLRSDPRFASLVRRMGLTP